MISTYCILFKKSIPTLKIFRVKIFSENIL